MVPRRDAAVNGIDEVAALDLRVVHVVGDDHGGTLDDLVVDFLLHPVIVSGGIDVRAGR